MDISHLVRDAKRVKDNWAYVNAKIDGTTVQQIITRSGCQIMIPARYQEAEMARIEQEISIAGVFAVIVDNKHYAVNKTCAMMHISPSSTEKVLIHDEPYLLFTFDPGSVVVKDTALVKRDVLTYAIFALFYSKGKVPWYMNYLDIASVFDSAQHHAGVTVGSQPEVIWLLASIISRDTKDITQYYRQSLKGNEDIYKHPQVTPLQKVSTSATNTFNKLAGNYMNEGIRSALISPAKRQERMERYLTG